MNQSNNFVLLRYNEPAINLDIANIVSIDAGENLLKVYTKDGNHYTGYHIKIE